MICELFREKKTQKDTQNFGKKKHNTFLLKKRGVSQNPNEWPMNFSVEKKITSCFFSDQNYDFGNKKNTIL